jgi:hypothetical protein
MICKQQQFLKKKEDLVYEVKLYGYEVAFLSTCCIKYASIKFFKIRESLILRGTDE